MRSPRRSRAFARPGRARFGADDRGVAGALGLILLLGVLVTALNSEFAVKIPRYGEDAEREWDAEIASAFRGIARSTSEGMESGVSSTAILPRERVRQVLSIPLVGSASPVEASGVVRFDRECTNVTARHALANGATVADLSGAARGCLAFRGDTIYTPSFGYVYELGGVLRIQGDRAVVLAGPVLDLDATNDSKYRVSLSLPGLRGVTVGKSVDRTDVHVDIVPGPASTEVEQEPNAANATWTFDTGHPEAWRLWFTHRFEQAGLVAARVPGPGETAADFSVRCVPADCSLDAERMGRVVVEIHGPRTDSADLKLSITYALVDLGVR